MAQTNLDPPAVVTAVVTAIFGNQALAEIVGPYSVIIVGAMVGASYSVSGDGTVNWSEVLAKLLKALGLALIATVPLSMLVVHWMPYLESRWVFGPMAILIGARNNQLPQDIKWLVNKAKSFRSSKDPGVEK